jgi:hypothetical protein
MKRISIEQSKKYISQHENIMGDEYSFFTIHDVDDEGWEQVEYFVNKRKDTNLSYTGEGQWVYVLSNKSMPGILKIGYTKLDPIKRLKQLSTATGVVVPFELEFSFKCYNAESLEREIHEYLNEYRINNRREFFKINIELVKETILNLGDKYKI